MPAGLPSSNMSAIKGFNAAWVLLASWVCPKDACSTMAAIGFGNALPRTEINPSAPIATVGMARASSPDHTAKWAGRLARMSPICSKSPLASLMPITLGCSAKAKVVAADMLHEVRPGTLYKMTGRWAASATAV